MGMYNDDPMDLQDEGYLYHRQHHEPSRHRSASTQTYTQANVGVDFGPKFHRFQLPFGV